MYNGFIDNPFLWRIGMVVSTKGRYALRVMIDIAKYGKDSYVTLSGIAERQHLSEKYLESIIKMLVQNGLVRGLRGKNGGYKLSRDASEITAWDVISVTENDFYVKLVTLLSTRPITNNTFRHTAKITDITILPLW